MSAKPHISWSQIAMWGRCGAQYYYRYCEGLKIPPNSALTQGRSCDRACNGNYEQKISTWQDLKRTDLTDIYTTEFDKLKPETKWQKDEKPAEVREQGIKLVTVFHEVIAPIVQPVTVQEKLWIPFADFPYDFTGVIDVTALKNKEEPRGPIIIRDNKTTAKSPPAEGGFAQESDRLQLAMYSLGLRQKTGKAEARVAVDYLVKTTIPKAVTVEAVIEDTDRQFALRQIGLVVDAIQKRVFVPNRVHFMCSRRQCGYASRCEKDFGGRVKE